MSGLRGKSERIKNEMDGDGGGGGGGEREGAGGDDNSGGGGGEEEDDGEADDEEDADDGNNQQVLPVSDSSSEENYIEGGVGGDEIRGADDDGMEGELVFQPRRLEVDGERREENVPEEEEEEEIEPEAGTSGSDSLEGEFDERRRRFVTNNLSHNHVGSPGGESLEKGEEEEEEDDDKKNEPVSPVQEEVQILQTFAGGGEQQTEERKPEEIPLKRILEAKEIYILMSKEYRISRNRRAEWFFSKVNTCVEFPPDEVYNFGEEEDEKGQGKKKKNAAEDNNGSSDFEVVSIIPLDPPSDWNFDERHSYRYHVNPDTTITYLSRRYRIVFCLDISPSMASVDVQAGGVVFDSIFKALQASLHGLLQPFEIPGSRRSFRPEIFLTVIAHTPFFTPVTDQILIQGQILKKETCTNIIRHIFNRLNEIENKIARLVIKRVHQLHLNSELDSPSCQYSSDEEDEVDGWRTETKPDIRVNGEMNGDENPNSAAKNVDSTGRLTNSRFSSFAMSPDFGLLDLLRQALIALSLMPENSSAGLVILTDGVISVPDGRYLDIILSQLRYNTVSCSFIQLSSPFHPHLCHGVIPYADLMKFIASATFGAFLSEAPEISEKPNAGMNVYHNAFLAWSFHKTLETEWNRRGPPAQVKPGEWSVRNKCFFSVRDMPIVKKQQYENTLEVDHMKVMSCRLREGFTIREVVTTPETGLSEVTLILPWKFLIHLEYKIFINSQDYLYDGLELNELDESGYPSKVRCAVSLEGPYDFLHDVTCLAKKPFPSLYRQLMVNRFWATRKNLSESDRLLVHLNSFSKNPAYYNIPESLRNGMPLFYWGGATNTATPQLHSNELSYPQFTHFWKPVCLLDTTVWQKWMHTHRVGVILEHDYPLPKNLHLPNSTGRFNVIQCRQAVMALNTLLKNMSSFVLLENQSYVHLMFKSEEDKVPHSFCLIRVTSKPPHVVLRIAFLVGTPGHLRHRTVAQFREKIATLTFPQRVKDPPKWRVIMNTPVIAKAATTASPLVNKTSWSEMPCCVIVHKPVEKILIRYDKCPEDFRHRMLSREDTNLYVPEGKSAQPRQSTFGFRPTYQATPVGSTSFQMLPEVFNTIARYLHHKRWIWWFPGGDLPPLNVKWASEILATVTKMRLQEGFRFAFSSAGITNMVLELPMKNKGSKKNTVTPMVIQFLVFPPTPSLNSDFEDFDSFESANSLYLVTECWVEPQCGTVTDDSCGSDLEDIPVVCKNFIDLSYREIPKLLFETDQKCISLVGTFEYLVRMCSHKDVPSVIRVKQTATDKPVVEENETIDVIPFEFDLRQLLMRSGQVEILFSSFFQDLSLTFPNEWNTNVCSFFERANSVLYQQWCCNIASFQDKEVLLTTDQHDVATLSVIQRKGYDDVLEEHVMLPKGKTPDKPTIHWRCFVRSSSSTHVLLTLVPASLKDLKQLLLHLDTTIETLHKTKSSRYVDFLELNYLPSTSSDRGIVMECPNQYGITNPNDATVNSTSSPQLADLQHQNCVGCLNANRKRVRAFSGGNECAPAVKKYFKEPPKDLLEEEKSTIESNIRSQTFSEGTVSGKLAHYMRTKRTLSDQSGGGNIEQEQEGVVCSDPQRCSQLCEYLNRCSAGSGHHSHASSGAGGAVIDDSQRYVPCRPPIHGSLALCLFTYSCSLMSLTEHVVFRKVSSDEMSKDFRMSRAGARCDQYFGDDMEDDDDDDLSTGSGSYPNGRSISQESFSESSLQRLEAAEHEQLLKTHCTLLRQTHLQAFISSAYRSLLSGYQMTSSDIKAVIERCALTRVKFPLDNFLQYVCKHEKELKSFWNEILQERDEDDDSKSEENSETEKNNDSENKDSSEDAKSSSSNDNNDVCSQLANVHQFIKRRFRRLLSRNFTAATENGHVMFYKIAGSNALSDVSGLGGGMVKCSSDLEDNLDSCSVIAESLCSGEEPFPLPSLHMPSDNETTDRSPGPTRHPTGTHQNNVADDQQSCGGFTATSVPSSGPVAYQYSPLFCYLTCGLQLVKEGPEGENVTIEELDAENGGFIPLMDIPTCYRELCLEHIRALSEGNENLLDTEMFLGPSSKFKLTMELTFLTCPESPISKQNSKSGEESSSGSDSKKDKLVLTLAEFKKRLSIRQSRALDHLICDIEWLMDDEINSFRGGGGGTVVTTENVNVSVLESIAEHIEKSLEKPGCNFQQIQLNFVEHSDEKGFQSFLDRFNYLAVNEYSFKQEGSWWYLVTTKISTSITNDGDGDGKTTPTQSSASVTPSSSEILPPFWILVKAHSTSLLKIYHHCRYDETDLGSLAFSRNLRVRIMDLISNLIRTINQDLLLQQLHDTRICSPLLEMEDLQDLDEGTTMTMTMDLMMMAQGQGASSKFGGDSESDISSTLPVGNFCPGMFSCQVVWVTTFTLHSRLRSGGGKTAFARGIQTLRSTLTAFEVANRKNMFVYRDATGNVFYMRFYRGVEVLEGNNSNNSPSKVPLDSIADDYPDSEITSMASDSSSVNRIMLKRSRNQDSESEKGTGRDDTFDGILALKVHGIVPAGEEIKEKLVQSLRNKLDDAVLDILSVMLKRNPQCKLTPEDVHFLQEPRSRPDAIFRFQLAKFIVQGHLPAFTYYLHQNLLQFLSMPKYTSQKIKYHFQDYSRLQDVVGEGSGEQSSVYLYNQSPGGGGTGNRGIAIVSMALTDKLGNLVKNPEWKQPELGAECELEKFAKLIETKEVGKADGIGDGEINGNGIMVEFNMWKQGRLNFDLLRGHVEQAIKQAGWDLLMEFKVMTAPLAIATGQQQQSQGSNAEEDAVFEEMERESKADKQVENSASLSAVTGVPGPVGYGMRRRSSHLNPATRSNSTGGALDEDDEPRMRSMSFTAIRKGGNDMNGGSSEQSLGLDRAPSPVALISGRGGSEGSRPRVLPSRSQSNQMSLTRLETGETGKLHSNYTELLDKWLENGNSLGTPSLRKMVIPLNCRYPIKNIVQELEKIISQVAPDNTSRQFWKHEMDVYMSCAGHGNTDSGERRRDSCEDEASQYTSEYQLMRRYERDLLALEGTEEAEYPAKLLNIFVKNENFQPSYEGHVCYLIARNLAHWKSCVNCETEFSVHTSQDFKNLYTYPPLLNENLDIDGSRGSIEKLPRTNFGREFLLWGGSKSGKSGTPFLIPRQRFLRAKVTSSEVDFVVYNWSKDCCDQLQEHVNYLSHWIQARASLLSSLLLQKSGLFYCQPILPDNFASPSLSSNPFINGDVDLKDLILNTLPSKHQHDRRQHAVTGGRFKQPPPPITKPTQAWTEFYRNIPLRSVLRMPEPTDDNPVDAHGKQLLHVMSNLMGNKEQEQFFQYWLTRGPSASNVITTQILESFKQTARTIHFCLTPVMFLPSWRAAAAQTRDSNSAGGGIIRRNRGSSRRLYHSHNSLHHPPTSTTSTSKLSMSRVRHGSEASQGSALSLRNRSRSYHSGMVNVLLHPETISEKDFETPEPTSPSLLSMSISPHQQQQQNLFLKVKSEDPWHGALCKIFIQEYMQYLQTLGFVPVHCKAGPSGAGNSSPGTPFTGILMKRSVGVGVNSSVGNTGIINKLPPISAGPSPSGESTKSKPIPVKSSNSSGNINIPGGNGTSSAGSHLHQGSAHTSLDSSDIGEEDERMIHFLQRCLPGGIIVIEVGLLPPFFYCKIHALEAKRIFPSKNNKTGNQSSTVANKNAIQFLDECEKMKVLTHLHSFMYDFHLRAMHLYISGRQILVKLGYHVTSFLDDFITYYPKCPNFSRNAVHIGVVTLEDVSTPSQVLFTYILGHDKQYRMKVIRMTPFNPNSSILEDSSSEYVLVHNMSRKVSYRSGGERGSGNEELEGQQQQDEFDLTLVIAHDYPSSSRDFIPDYNGLRVKYYIVLTSRRELYPKGDNNPPNEPSAGKLLPVNTPEPLCTRHQANCSNTSCISNALSKLVPPPAPPPSFFEGFEGNLQPQLQHHHYRRQQQYPDMIKEEKVRYMGYFSSHEQLMQKVIDEQKDTMEQFIRQLITKAAVDCRRDLYWDRLLYGRNPDQSGKASKSKSTRSLTPSVATLKEDIISREILGPLYYNDFNELLELVQVVPLRTVDPRLEELVGQPIGFYQTLMKVLIASSGNSNITTPAYYYREFSSADGLVHQLAIFTQDTLKSVVMIEIKMNEGNSDIYLVFKDGKKHEQQQQSQASGAVGVGGVPPPGEFGEALYALVERIVNACCYTTWASLI